MKRYTLAVTITARVERPEDDDYRAAQVRPSLGAEPQIRPVTAELSGPVSAPIEPPRRKSGILGKLFMFLLFVGGLAVAFAGGMALRERFVAATGVPVPVLDKPPAPPNVAFRLMSVPETFRFLPAATLNVVAVFR